MNSKLSLLFYLSLGSVITLTIASLFYFPAPINIFLLFLLIPSGVYMILSFLTVIKKSHEDHATQEKALQKIKTSILYFSLTLFALNISSFTIKQILFPIESASSLLATKEITTLQNTIKQMEQEEKKNKQIAKKLEDLTQELADLRTALASTPGDNKELLDLIDTPLVLGTSAANLISSPQPTKIPATYVTVKNSQQKVDVLETKYSSKIVGYIEYPKQYQIVKSEDQYYLINLDSTGSTNTNQGWVSTQFVNAY